MPRLEFGCKPPIPVDGDNVDDREPKPVIKLREGLSVLRQFEHKAADVLGLGFPLGLCRLELLQLGLGGFVACCYPASLRTGLATWYRFVWRRQGLIMT